MNVLASLPSWSLPDAYLPDIIILCVLGALLALYLALQSTFRVRLEQSGIAQVLQELLRNPDDIRQGRSLTPRRRMRQAGLESRRVIWWWVFQMLLPVLLGLLVLRVMGTGLGGLAGLLMGILLPHLWLGQRRRERQTRIAAALGHLLAVSLAYQRHGLSLAASLREAARQALPPAHPLAFELELFSAELEGGLSLKEAASRISRRTGSRELHQFAMLLVAGNRMGNPLHDVLEAFAAQLARQQSERQRKAMQQRSVKALFPMLLVGGPLFFVLVIFPASLRVQEVLILMRELW